MQIPQQQPAYAAMALVYKLPEGYFSAYLSQLSGEWEVKIENDTVYCPDSKGTGFVRNVAIDTNCCVRYVSILPAATENFTLFNEVSATDHCYKLVIHINSLKKIKDRSSFQPHTFLYGNQKVKTTTLPAQSDYSRLVILFNEIWLENHFPVLVPKLRQLTTDHFSAAGIVPWKPGTGGNYNILQLVTEISRPAFSREDVKSMTYQLLHDLFHKLSHTGENDDPSQFYYSVEQLKIRIENSVTEGWPGIDQLAAEFYMKTSTLKRHFKTVAGINIYEYYQQKRMEWGKKELMKPGVKIGDIAHALGFAKHSNFGSAFKKAYGITPMEFKRDVKYNQP